MRKRKAFRNHFTIEQFRAYGNGFAALPKSLADPASPVTLADLWKRGGVGAISILPHLSMIAGLDCRDRFALSAEELSRMVGCHPQSIRTARELYEELDIATTRQCQRRGKLLLEWNVSAELAGPRIASGRYSPDHFYFPMTLIHGGQWMMLSGIQKLVFLAVGMRSSTHKDRPSDNWLVSQDVIAEASLKDIESDFSTSQHSWFRAASVSLSELSTITGASKASISKAVQSFKAPSVWGADARTNATLMRYSPMWVYPTNGGNLLYHIRGHVPCWPFDILNEPALTKWSETELLSRLALSEMQTTSAVAGAESIEAGLPKNPAPNRSGLSSISESQVQEAFEHWKKACNIRNAWLDRNVASAFQAVIQEFGLSKVKSVATYAAKDPYLNGTKNGKNRLWWSVLYKDRNTMAKHLHDSARAQARDTRAVHLSATRELGEVEVF